MQRQAARAALRALLAADAARAGAAAARAPAPAALREWAALLRALKASEQHHRGFAAAGGAGAPRPAAAAAAPPPPAHPTTHSPTPPTTNPLPMVATVLYRGAGMRLFRVLVRLKVFQLAGAAAAAAALPALAAGELSALEAGGAAALAGGAFAAGGALWFYSRRYVGELALLAPRPMSGGGGADAPTAAGALLDPPPTHARLSVLDFWGRREDVVAPLGEVAAPLAGLAAGAASAEAARPLLPLRVGRRQFVLSVRYGRVLEPALLRALLAGALPGAGGEGGAAAREGGA
jgi:hypothetical protein